MFTHGFEDTCGPPGYTQVKPGLSMEQYWAEVRGEPVGPALTPIPLRRGQFLSLSFDRSTFDPQFGELITFYADTSNVGVGNRGADYRYVAIGSCPGDFSAAIPQGCKAYANEGPFLYLNFGTPMAHPQVCDLKPGATYYVSFVYDDPSDGWQPLALCNSMYPPETVCAFRMSVD